MASGRQKSASKISLPLLRETCICILLCINLGGYAQVASTYSFSTFSRTYVGYSISPFTWVATTCTPNVFISTGANLIHNYPLGFTFNFGGVNYSSVNVCSNGFLSFSNDTAAPYTNIKDSITGPGMLMPYWDRLYGYTPSGVYETLYGDSGIAPHRMFLFEWATSWFPYGFLTGSGSPGRFQVRLYETTNIIEFCYSAAYGYGTVFSGTSATIGIANSTTDWQTLNNTGSSPTPSSVVWTDTLSVGPTPNQVYRWTPTPCTGTPAAGTVSATAAAACTAYTSSLSLSGATVAYGITYQWQSSPDSAAWTNISGATNTTTTTTVTANTYYRCVTTCTGSGLIAASPGLKLVLYPLPPAITGTMNACTGAATALNDSAGGGAWSSGNTSVATVGTASGTVYGITAGTAAITYTLPTGCTATAIVTVYTTPSPITGATTVCPGATTTLSDAVSGGVWSSPAGSAGVATVSPAGTVTGVGAGAVTISYTTGGSCMVTLPVIVYPLPSGITGTVNVCPGATTALYDSTSGGTWSSGNASIATIGSVTGMVTGVFPGSVFITYTAPTGCAATATVIVNTPPAIISGTPYMCPGEIAYFTDATPGGAWSSSNTAIATTILSPGMVTAVAAGSAAIIYTVSSTGCSAGYSFIVNPGPAPISAYPSICVGTNDHLSDSTGGGTWGISGGGVATITPTGIVTGLSVGTTTVTYTLPSGCAATTIVTIDASAGTITGDTNICVGSATTLSDTVAGGLWHVTGVGGIVSVDSVTGVVTGLLEGFTSVRYSLGLGCTSTIEINVNYAPAAITGIASMCSGISSIFSDSTAGGTWSPATGAVATVDATGLVTGGGAGTARISYTTSTGCYALRTVTVNATPLAISGTPYACAGTTTSLSDSPTGGTWTSSSASVATVGSLSGIIFGAVTGTTTVSYTRNGCSASVVVTINAPPGSITGTPIVCVGNTTTLIDGGGGTWASGNTAVATAGTGGIVGGLSAGTAVIIYTLPTGCSTTKIVTVNPLPDAGTITGIATVCALATTALADAAGGGTWSSSTGSIATVGSTGIVTGVSAGTAAISYSVTNSCGTAVATRVVTVNPLPVAGSITGTASMCAGSITSLSDAAPGGAWSSGTTAVATVGSSAGSPSTGTVTGISAGTTTISYVVINGCGSAVATRVVTVNPIPVISGPSAVCAGVTMTESGSSDGRLD